MRSQEWWLVPAAGCCLAGLSVSEQTAAPAAARGGGAAGCRPPSPALEAAVLVEYFGSDSGHLPGP